MSAFVVLEGPEGAGKTTQLERLAARVPDAVVTREPGGTRGGEAVRATLLDPDAAWSPLAEALLMSAARDAHLREVVLPALGAGRTVLCDRFADSTEAYQGGGGGLPDDVIGVLRGWVCPREADLVLVFDIDPEAGLARAAARGRADRFEAKGLAYHARVRERFREVARRENAVLIDASGPPHAVAVSVAEAVAERLPGVLRAGDAD